ncbi:uncharacterized protein [Antedon mediterranea]|uniref:uncharacterized protein n=1 Tax=Antedon mediterranea TaxID=105859 RepID=UPI003AF937F3
MLKWGHVAHYIAGARLVSTNSKIIRSFSNFQTSQIVKQVACFSEIQSCPVAHKYQQKNVSLKNYEGDLFKVDRLLSRLSLSPTELDASLAFIVPSKNPIPTTIVEPIPTPLLEFPREGSLRHLYDPLAEIRDNIFVPSYDRCEKKAKNRITNEIHRRRRKMNHHQYKKWRKKMKFKLRMIKQKRQKRKQKKWERYLEEIKFKGLTKEEGEAYLKDKEERLKIYLRYLGFEGDAVKTNRKFKPRGIQYVRRPKKITRILEEGTTGNIVPTPLYNKS